MTEEQQRTQRTTNVRQRGINVNTEARLAILERDVGETLNMVRQIDAALRFPEQSPVGRALTERADRNAANITGLRTDLTSAGKNVDDLQKSFDELNGVVKALRLIGVLVSIVLGFLTIMQAVRPPS